MWNSKRSTKLSLILTDIIFAAAIAVGIFLPFIAGWYIEATGKTQALKAVLITVCYCCLPFAAAGFFALILRVIKNVFCAAIEIKNENELTI